MSDISEIEVDTIWTHNRRRKQASRFLKGPIPLSILQKASCLPGKALGLYLAIRHRADLQRREEVSLPTAYLAAWGINKDAKRRAIAALEQAKLIQIVDRRPGHGTRVALRN